MNEFCQCEGPGFCPRHQIEKDLRHFRYCKGLANTPDCGHKFWQAWEQGNLGATAPEEPQDNAPWNCKDRIIEPVAKRVQVRENDTRCQVGTRLKGLIYEKYKLQASGSCSCNKHAAEMDRLDCKGCRDSFDTIVEWLIEGAAERIWIRPIVKFFEKSTRKAAESLLLEALELEEARVAEIYRKRRIAREQRVQQQQAGPRELLRKPERPRKVIPWAYGVTTVVDRLQTTLPQTLRSLRQAGFEDPWLFVDGVRDPDYLDSIEIDGRRLSDYSFTLRWPLLKTFGNWALGLWELFIRQPLAQRYAMFQDDLITYPNLKSYLSHCQFPDRGTEKGYWNLYTFPKNQDLAEGREGWYPSNQRGLGAVGLVFCRDCVMDLLSSKGHIVERPATPGKRAWSNIDGGIVTALSKLGWKEYVHNPSLIQHTGETSTIGSSRHPQAPSFRGEDFDARELIRGRV